MSLTRAVAWNTAVQVAGRVLGLGVSMAITAILTRHLGLATYGQMVAATTYIGLFIVLGDSGLYLVAVRRAAQEPDRRTVLLGNAFGLRLAIAFVPLALGYLLVQFVPTERFPIYVPAVKLAVAVLAVNGYLTLLNQFMMAVFRLHLRMDLAVLGEMIARLVTLAAVGVLVVVHGGLVGAVLALATGTFANFVYAWLVGRRFERFRPQLRRHLSVEMLRETAVLTAVTLLGLIHFRVDTLLLSVMRTAEEVGIYGVAYKVHEVLITFPGLFVGLLYPVFSKLSRDDPARLRHVFQRAFDVLVVTSIGAALMVFVLAPDLAILLGGPPAAHAMRILAFALPAVFVSLGFTHLLLAEARQRWLVPLYLLLVLTNVLGNVYAIHRWSYIGAASMTVVTEGLALTLLSLYWIGYRRLRLAPRSTVAVPLAIGIAALGAGAFAALGVGSDAAIPRVLVRLALAGGLTVAVYAAGILWLRILPREAWRSILPGARDEPSSSLP